MTRLSLLACVLLLAVALASRGEAEEAAGVPVAAGKVLADMKWLAGTWSGAMWGGTFEAYYSTPEGGKILSFSRLMRGTRQAFHEFEVFACSETTVHMQPFPRGRPVDGLTLKQSFPKERKAVFENPKKDYPTRIVYHRVSDAKLVITLSDPHGNSGKAEKFELARKP